MSNKDDALGSVCDVAEVQGDGGTVAFEFYREGMSIKMVIDGQRGEGEHGLNIFLDLHETDRLMRRLVRMRREATR